MMVQIVQRIADRIYVEGGLNQHMSVIVYPSVPRGYDLPPRFLCIFLQTDFFLDSFDFVFFK